MSAGREGEREGEGRGSVALVGMRGAGKSTVARLLAARLGMRFVDCDSRLEQRRRISIREIFERHGEAQFRRWEREVLLEVLGEEEAVIATGGGVVLRPDNVRDLRRAARVVYVRVEPAILACRIEGDPGTASRRPPLVGGTPAGEVERVLGEREGRYRRAADLVVEAGERAAGELAGEIAAWVRGLH